MQCYICNVEKSEILREVMDEVGMTQPRLSSLSGVKQPSLSQMLHGRVQMSDHMLDRLLSCMGYRLEVVRRPVPVKLDRSSRRRWLLHERLVESLNVENWSKWRPTVRRNLKNLRSSTRGEPHVSNLDRWGVLVETDDLRGIRRVMTGLDVDSIQMREVSPFGGLLSQKDREEVLAKAGP